MPKPYLLTRPSGLVVRFLVPADLRGQVGSRFIVRSLGARRGDHARLAAASMAVALSSWFEGVRQGVAVVDIKKLLESAQRAADSGTTREWTASGVQIGRVNFGDVEARGREDTLDFIQAVRAALEDPNNQGPIAVQAPKLAAQVATPAPEPDSPKLSDEIANHLADLERRQLASDTITESRHSLRIFLAVTGDIPVSTIKVAHARAFLDAVRWWPERATIRPEFRGMSVLDIIAEGKKRQVQQPSKHTLNKHHQRLGAFLNGLVKMDLLTKNPLKALDADLDTSTDLDTGRPFTPEELSKMFEPERFRRWAKYPHRWWGAILGLYTGARVNEIAQLYLDDVRQINGVWGVFFWKSARGAKGAQKIKNKSSIRFVPLAEPVLNAGFLDFVEDMRQTGHPRLFPHLPAGTKKDGTPNGKGYGRQLSRQFAAYMKTIGIEKGTAFHSFRHTMSTTLAEAGVASMDIAMITGHTVPNQVPTLDNHYIHIAQTATLAKRVETLAKFQLEIPLPAYAKGQMFTQLRSDSFHS